MSEICGDLEHDSPACIKLIKKNFAADFLLEMKKLYSDLNLVSKIQEPTCTRDEKVRFNPRAARIIHILISEAKCLEKSVIRSAFEVSFDNKSLVIENLLKLDSLKIDILLLCSFLDELRHLHMNPKLTRDQLEHALGFTQELDQHGYLDLNQRLKNLILNYQKRILTQIKLLK